MTTLSPLSTETHLNHISTKWLRLIRVPFLAVSLVCLLLPGIGISTTKGTKASGRVYLTGDNHRQSLEGVLVSDGYSFVKTDEQGRYEIELHDQARWVTFVNPRGTMPTMNMHHMLPLQHSKLTDLDFTVKPMPHSPEEPFRFVHQSDLHVSREYHVSRNYEKMVRYINQMPNPPAFVLDSGDFSNDSIEKMQWARQLFDLYDMPVFPVMGNHDRDDPGHSGVPGREAYRGEAFEHIFAPLYYAYTYNNYLFLNLPWESYHQEGIEWHTELLSHIGDHFHVVSNQHHWDGLQDRYREYFDLLKQYNAAGSFVGHYHVTQMLEIEGIPQFKITSGDGMQRDLAIDSYFIVTAFPDGRMIADYRNRGFDHYVQLVHPAQGYVLKRQRDIPLLVNAYDTALDVENVQLTVIDPKSMSAIEELYLQNGGGQAWTGKFKVGSEWPEEVVLKVKVTDERGISWPVLRQTASVQSTQAEFNEDHLKVETGDDWGMWQGNPARSGYVATGPEPPLKLAWVHVNRSFGLSAPIVANGRIFVGVMNNITPTDPFPTVLALDAKTGQELWSHEVSGGRSVRNTLASDGERVAAHLCDGTIMALNARNGERLWKDRSMITTLRGHQIFFGASPIVTDGMVFTGLSHFLGAFDLDDGTVKWSEQPERGGGGFAFPSILMGEDTLFDGQVQARDPETGLELEVWQPEVRMRSTLTPVLGEKYLIAPVAVQRERWIIKAIDPLTAEVAWKTPFYGEIRRHFSSPAVADGRVYFLFGHTLFALDEVTGKILWRTWIDGAGKRRGGRLKVDAHGEIEWQSPQNDPNAISRVAGDYDYASKQNYEIRSMHVSPVVAGDYIFIVTSEGSLNAFKAKDGRPVWQFDMGTNVSSGIAVSGNALFVSGRNGALYAFITASVDE